MQRQTNWYVITGGPGSGKTTTVNLLKERGYITTFEHARHYLDTQRLKGKTIEDVRKRQREFQLGVLDMQYRMWFEITPAENGTIAKISISYLPPKEWYYKILSFLFAKWYCNWFLNNMLHDSENNLEKNRTD